MKRIEFIAPVEAMRGNLSGAQKLQYPTDNQGAYEGPVGSVNYARNYSPRFVGAKRAKDGFKYFSVRTKSANHLTAKAKTAMALLGGAGAMYAAIVRNKNSQLYTSLYAQYLKFQELGDKRTFRAFLMDVLRRGLMDKTATIVVAGPLSPITIDNPWNTTQSTPNVQVSQAILVKFFMELAANAVEFEIVGAGKCYCKSTDMWGDLVDADYNVLNLKQTVIGGTHYIMYADKYVMSGTPEDPGDYAEAGNGIEADINTFFVTNEQPS